MLGVTAVARFVYIVYGKERWLRRKPPGHDLYEANGDSPDGGDDSPSESHNSRSMKGATHGRGGAPVARVAAEAEGVVELTLPPLARVKSSDSLMSPRSNGLDQDDDPVSRRRERNLRDEPHNGHSGYNGRNGHSGRNGHVPELLPRVLPRASSWTVLSDATPRSAPTLDPNSFASNSGLLPRHQRSGSVGAKRSWVSSKVQPATSPVRAAFDLRPDMTHPNKLTPRQAAGLDVSVGGSLWDRTITSPIQPQVARTPLASGNKAGESDRDQFEEALLRAVHNKWADSRPSSSSVPGSRGTEAKGLDAIPLSRSLSMPDVVSKGVGKKDAMLRAGKCWICVCSFENSVGQKTCVDCGRIGPTGHGGPGGRRGRSSTIIRQGSSWVPSDDGQV